MKKLLVLALTCFMAVGASAQKNWTLWYGLNFASMDAKGQSTDFAAQPLNLGVIYSSPFAEGFDWNAGLSYQTKGFKPKGGGDSWNPGLLQLDANVGYNLFNIGDDLKLGAVTGPFINYIVVKDDAKGINEFGAGWQIGLRALYKDFSLRAGFEYNITKTFDGGRSSLQDIYVRIGYSF